jgi:hypothetical protein
MALSLNTRYYIHFPNHIGKDQVLVTVTDDPGVPVDHFVLELEASSDQDVEKVRVAPDAANSLALCTDGQYCLNGANGEVYVEISEFSARVISPVVSPSYIWFPSAGVGLLELTLYFTTVPSGQAVDPCDDLQPETADPRDDPSLQTVGAFPMVFVYKGTMKEAENPGKKIKVIWKKDI